MKQTTAELLKSVKAYFDTDDVVYGKGGFFVRGKGFISISKARSLTGLEAPKREFRGRALPWGDYATVAMFNQPRKRSK